MTIIEDFRALDHEELQQRVQGLAGQPFSDARSSYGGELQLAFGTGTSRLAGWALGTRMARWILLGDVGVVARDTDGRAGVRAFAVLHGATVTAVDATRVDRTLVLVFSTGHRFVLLPNKPHRTRDDLDLWELFSPHGWWLAIRRDGTAELVPEDSEPSDPKGRSIV